MIDRLWNWMVLDFWRTVASFAAGVLIIATISLIPSFRKRLEKTDVDIEGIGMIALITAIVAVGCYNYFGSGSGT